MTTSSETSRLDLACRLRPVVPSGDDRHAASAVLNQVLERSAALHDELRTIANRHVDDAPASSEHVLDLTAVVARTVLDWIERWPS